jgi:HSP20 family molecular chaperone IbpA
MTRDSSKEEHMQEERSEMLGRRHGKDSRPSQQAESPAERQAQIQPHEDRQPQHLTVKLYRTSELVTVAAPMPGLGPGDIAVVVSPERRLVIVGRLCADDADATCGTLKQPAKDVLLDEWEVGPYRRELDLPCVVDGGAATVTYGNGILVVALPVAQVTRPARLTLENVSSGVRAARVGQENRQVGGAPSDAQNARRGVALVASGAAMLYMLRRHTLGGRLLALATGTMAPMIANRLRRTFATRSDGDPECDTKLVSERKSDNPVDEASWESFPASDPPSWTGTRARAFD